MTPYPPFVVETLRRALRTGPGRSFGRMLYRGAAPVCARVLGGIDGVVAVYAGGSFRKLDTLEPGYSDLDFMLITRRLSDDTHLAFRETLARRLRTLRLAFPAVQTVDYLAEDELPLVRRHGNDYGRTLDARFVHLAGARPLDPDAHAAKSPRELELVFVLRRWLKASGGVLRSTRDVDFDRARVTRRLFADVAATYLEIDRLDPFESIVARAARLAADARHADALEALGRTPGLARRADEHARTTLVTATLALLERFADECSRTFGDALAPERYEASNPPFEHTLRARLGVLGAHRAYVVPGTTRSRAWQVFVTLAPELSLERFVREGARLLEHADAFAHAHLVLLTPALVRAGALLDPIPLAGHALARRMLDEGDTSSTIVRSPELDVVMARAMLAQGLWRAPSIRFHSELSPARARDVAASELAMLDHLADFLEGAPLTGRAPAITLDDERALVRALRRHQERVCTLLSVPDHPRKEGTS